MRLLAALRSVELGGPAGVWRELVTRADVASATGVRHALHRLSHDLRHADVGGFRRAVAKEIWASAAERVGAQIVEIGDGFLELRKGGSWTRVYEQTLPLNDEVARRLANQKSLVYQVLRAKGIPVPDHLEFSSRQLSRAIEFLQRGPVPCVVKPGQGYGGLGVTSQVCEPRDLRRAARWASRFGDRLLIERQIEGDVYRILVLDGVVLDAVRLSPPRITGNGHSTIAALIEAEYERRLLQSGGEAGIRPFVIDLDCLLTLRRDGLTPRSVLGAGTTVRVKTVTNQNRVEDNETALDAISDELGVAAVAAASVVGLRVAGVDVVTPDPGRGLAESGGVVIDLNDTPGLWHHYRVRDPSAATDVAAAILRTLLSA